MQISCPWSLTIIYLGYSQMNIIFISSLSLSLPPFTHPVSYCQFPSSVQNNVATNSMIPVTLSVSKPLSPQTPIHTNTIVYHTMTRGLPNTIFHYHTMAGGSLNTIVYIPPPRLRVCRAMARRLSLPRNNCCYFQTEMSILVEGP